jgi:hypothetical protein
VVVVAQAIQRARHQRAAALAAQRPFGALGAAAQRAVQPPLDLRQVQRQVRAGSAALLRARAIPLVGQEVLEGGAQEDAELAAPGIDVLEEVALDEGGEEALGEVLGRVEVVAALAQQHLHRPPVAGHEVGQGRAPALEVAAVTRLHHLAPGHVGEAVVGRGRRRGRPVVARPPPRPPVARLAPARVLCQCLHQQSSRRLPVCSPDARGLAV